MPVVYDGVEGGGKGGLFEGLKLWISRRVPQRSRWVSLVEGNGGEVVLLEKQADMLIADHVKRGGAAPPPGSYSWQWIDFSMRNRSLQHREDFLITPAEPRAAGSTTPAKKSRTLFSNHDDVILAKYVQAKERSGESTRGNEIFREFERRHPRHPWQSWRDRWVKHLSNRPRPNLPDEDSQPEVEVAGSPEPSGPAQSPQIPRTPRVQPHRTSDSTPVLENRPKGRNFFTKEEDRLLLDFIQEAQEYNETAVGRQVRSLSGNKIYKELAEMHPRHTWHAWRDRWVRHLSRTQDAQDDADAQQDEDAESHVKVEPQPQPHPRLDTRRLTTAEKLTARSAHAEASEAGTAAVLAPGPSPTANRPKAMSDEERLERQELARRKARAARLLQRTWRGIAERRDQARFETLVVPLQSLVRGYLVRMREAERLNDAQEANDQRLEDDPNEVGAGQYEDAEESFEHREEIEEGNDARSARDQFYDDLQDYIEISGAEIDRQPLVNGRRIDLWDLFRAATRQTCNPEDRKWKEVADELGFDWTKSAICLPELWNCYIQNLGEFEEAIKSYEHAEDEDEEEDQQQPKRTARDDNESPSSHTSDAVTAPKGPSVAFSPSGYRSSPPVAAVKRSFRQIDIPSSDLTYPSDGSRKRRRLEQRAEIPPTPEGKLGLVGQTRRGEAYDKASPLKARGATAPQLIEIETAEVADELLNGDMEDVEGVDELPEHPQPPKKRFVEPETQDFGFALDGDEDDNSPSQQLRLESDDINHPVQPGASGQNAAPATSQRSLAPKPKVAGNSASRPTSLKSGIVARSASMAPPQPSRAVNGQTTKRSLPQQYQKPPASAPPGRISGDTPLRNGMAQPRPGPRSSVLGRPPGHVASPYTAGPASRARQATSLTPMLPTVSSSAPLQPPSSRHVPASSAPPLPQDRRGGLQRAQSPSFDNDPAVIDAQFAHFQALGYEKAHIGRALEAATFQRGPMTVALQSLHEGHGLPRKEPGVWTDDDDDKLKVVRDYDRRGQKGRSTAGSEQEAERLKAAVERYRARLTAKHGKWMEPRLRFMDMMDEGA